MPPRLILSLAALVLVNVVPLAGVLLLGWGTMDVLMVFWAENVVIGVYTALRMASRLALRAEWSALALIPFFAVHYGIFCAGHGFFLLGMSGMMGGQGPLPPISLGPLAPFGMLAGLMEKPAFLWAVVGIALSHGVSFVLNFLLGREFDRTTSRDIMGQPYARVMILHVTIIFGAIAVMQLGSPVWALALLVLLKIGVDVVAHLRERKKLAGSDGSVERAS
jgi:hypothetical protein